MTLTNAAITNNRTTWILFAVLMLAGVQAFKDLPRAYDPGFIIRAAQVVTYLPGASSDRMEELVTNQIEQVVQEIPELDFVTSTSKTGVSIVVANIKENYTSMRPIWDDLRRKIQAVTPDLPEGIIGPVVNDEFGDVYGIVIALTAEGYTYSEMKTIADNARDDLLNLEDAAKIDLLGIQDERVFVEYDNAKLTELNLSPAILSSMIKSRNIIVPGGSIVIGNERIELEPSGNFETVDDIGNTILPIPGSKNVVYLRDIARVKSGYVDPPSSLVRFKGEDAIGIAISMREGGNNIELGNQVQRELARLSQEYPIGVDFNVVNFSPKEVDDKVKGFVLNLLQAIAVVAAVMLLSLGLRTGLIVSLLIPASMLAALLVMINLEIGLDQISLAALIIALGMLVDNGIVMSESILVQMKEGKSPMESALSSANELKMSLLTSSLTTAAAFLPIYLAESAVGEFTASLFKVVTITLLCSWLISMTVVPMLCVHFLKVDDHVGSESSAWQQRYERFLRVCLRYRSLVLVGIAGAFVGAVLLMQQVPKIFFPPSDRLYFKMEVEFPIGADIEATASMTALFDRFLEKNLEVNEERDSGVTSWVSYIGQGGPRFVLNHTPEPASPNYSLFIINVSDQSVIDESMRALDEFAINTFPDLKITLKRIENGTPVKNPVEYRLYADDVETLFERANQLKAKMASVPELRNIVDDWGIQSKKFEVVIDQARARRAGISSEDIAVSLQTGLSGLELTEYRRGEDIIPVMLRSQAADRQDIAKLEGLSVYVQSSGESLPLKQVADLRLIWEPAKILRRDRKKSITIGAQLTGDATAIEGFSRVTPWLEKQAKKWELGSGFELGGEIESSGKANDSITEKLPVAAFIILILLVAQFNSLRKSAIILVTIPLGFIGVSVGLFLANSFFGFMTLLGVISLAGIVINNAIVLLERIDLEIEDNGLAPFEAILSAGKRRLRPILLTTATTVLGMLPLYFGGGLMWEPMAVAIIAGLLFSTVLTLVLVPVLYSLLYRVTECN
ncbi:acriflavine resistance protein B [Oleiphilus sp. HI0071]|uniref:efflux RND transporter permease subunit n=5 Tax=unclassified Oleiphilus TaxID=2631174 RepID=UPI0007C22095|nr:efflux RND transporter permease subunit [Oleiphilus sp. HI0079]KZY73308.1 acriflavine resistance protein B [Oleiphilus sp. HI0065]KZY86701.1 acriflavine resistance protein B [Oleiphilus sp. HI0071]KZZ05783.1 acriflavine resistance protein B [Oleiphilus sp. HI0073]KZZ43443.1 acriflavine resistance protein B [Oleiphilus sp. HI0118]KZZ48748.1 acriflavine resistance protein B [Oleiphilus sp. HI0122]KZZ77547.1 acriflavine resistance protein B [Oleiphilus sp. HI0133]